jgi:hypothetical protein
MKFSSQILLGLISLAACLPPALAEDGWSVNQNATGGAALTGAMTLYITPNGMRAYEAKNGINLMTHGPNWQVYIYNDKTKRMYSSQLNPWLQSFRQRGMVGRFQGATWKRGRDNGVVAGIRAYEFVMDHPPPIRSNYKGLNGRATALNTLRGASLWVASDIKTPPQVSNLLSNLYGVPDCQRIPLRVVLVETGRGQSTAVETSRAVAMNVPDSIFAVPSGYTPAKSDTDVFIDKESMDTLDEMLNDLDTPSTHRRPGAPAGRPGMQAQPRPGMPQARPGTQPQRRPGQ